MIIPGKWLTLPDAMRIWHGIALTAPDRRTSDFDHARIVLDAQANEVALMVQRLKNQQNRINMQKETIRAIIVDYVCAGGKPAREPLKGWYLDAVALDTDDTEEKERHVNMTVKEASAAKVLAQKRVADILVDLERDTEMKVEAVHLEYVHTLGGKPATCELKAVEIDLEMP